MDQLVTHIDHVWYSNVEEAITSYFDMGYADSSDLPVEFEDKEVLSCECYITATKKHGRFSILIIKEKDGYRLQATPRILKSHRK